MAGRFPLPALRECGGYGAAPAAVVAVLGVPLPGVGDGGLGAAPDADTAAPVVLGGVPGDDRDARDLRSAAAAPAGSESVRDRLDDAAQLRRAMVNPERGQLTGAVEVDECFVGGHAEGLRGGREHGVKALVVVAVEIRGAGSGRVRLQVIDDAAAGTLCGFVTATVASGTAVHTDAWQGYKRLTRLGYDHRPRSQRAHRLIEGDPDEILPRVHRVICHLKTWLQGTHRGVSAEHLQVYLDEFTFRFNRRRTPMAGFQTLLGLGGQTSPTTYDEIIDVGPGHTLPAELTG